LIDIRGVNDPAEAASAESPLKRGFSGVINPEEFSNRRCGSITFFKGSIEQKYLIDKYPLYLRYAGKKLGNSDFISCFW
jgi:hypothetical protein